MILRQMTKFPSQTNTLVNILGRDEIQCNLYAWLVTVTDIGQLIPSASRDQANEVKLSTPWHFIALSLMANQNSLCPPHLLTTSCYLLLVSNFHFTSNFGQLLVFCWWGPKPVKNIIKEGMITNSLALNERRGVNSCDILALSQTSKNVSKEQWARKHLKPKFNVWLTKNGYRTFKFLTWWGQPAGMKTASPSFWWNVHGSIPKRKHKTWHRKQVKQKWLRSETEKMTWWKATCKYCKPTKFFLQLPFMLLS